MAQLPPALRFAPVPPLIGHAPPYSDVQPVACGIDPQVQTRRRDHHADLAHAVTAPLIIQGRRQPGSGRGGTSRTIVPDSLRFTALRLDPDAFAERGGRPAGRVNLLG